MIHGLATSLRAGDFQNIMDFFFWYARESWPTGSCNPGEALYRLIMALGRLQLGSRIMTSCKWLELLY